MEFEFKCTSCGEIHQGLPIFGAELPAYYFEIPEDERTARCVVGADDCVVDDEFFFVRGLIEVPIHGEDEAFLWGVWVSLSETSYQQWLACYDAEVRSDVGPFFGWLNTYIKPYPDTVNLKTRAHLRDHFEPPYIELEPTDHPLAVEQREGISKARAVELFTLMMHGRPG